MEIKISIADNRGKTRTVGLEQLGSSLVKV